MKILNPFYRTVQVRYWHGEVRGRKRLHKMYVERRVFYYDGPTPDAVAKALRHMLTREAYTAERFLPVIEKKLSFRIPIWSRAFWFPRLEQKYMARKGYSLEDNN